VKLGLKKTTIEISVKIMGRLNALIAILEEEKGRRFSKNDIIGLLLDLYDDCKKKKAEVK